MTYIDFRRLLMDAQVCNNFDEFTAKENNGVPYGDAEQTSKALEWIWDYSRDRSFDHLLKMGDYKKTELARTFGIPMRSIQNWCGEICLKRTPRNYFIDIMSHELMLIHLSGKAEQRRRTATKPRKTLKQ